MEKIRIAVIFGGRSSEHEISLRSATTVLGNLSEEKYEPLCIGITKAGKWLLYSGSVDRLISGAWETDPQNKTAFLSPDTSVRGIVVDDGDKMHIEPVDVIFPVLHGKNGEDGTIQGLFELSGIPYVGCGTLASAVCMDKAVTHTLLAAAQVEQTQYLWFYADRYVGNPVPAEKIRKKIEARLEFPIFVKPANAGSSVGITKVKTMAELDAAVEKAAREDSKIVVEEGVVGQEIECAVIGNREAKASTVGEIGASAEFYDYDDKYNSGTSETFIPARLPAETIEKIREIAVHAYRMLGCSGLARVDFFVRKKDGKILLNEINTLPGFTRISMYPKLWEACGKNGTQLIDELITLAFQKKRGQAYG